MRPFILDFRERRREVRRYLAVLKIMERRMSSSTLRRYEDEARVFRAGAILVIYNTLEASARSAIEAIYDEIQETNTPFNKLRVSLRKRVISDFKKHASQDRHCSMRDEAVDLVINSFNSGKLFSGNVDAQEIKAQARAYGFVIPDSDYARSRNGEELVKVKQKRNDLAHGTKSFSEVGKEYSLREIMDLGRYCMAYMDGVLSNIASYLDSADYMEKSA